MVAAYYGDMWDEYEAWLNHIAELEEMNMNDRTGTNRKPRCERCLASSKSLQNTDFGRLCRGCDLLIVQAVDYMEYKGCNILAADGSVLGGEGVFPPTPHEQMAGTYEPRVGLGPLVTPNPMP